MVTTRSHTCIGRPCHPCIALCGRGARPHAHMYFRIPWGFGFGSTIHWAHWVFTVVVTMQRWCRSSNWESIGPVWERRDSAANCSVIYFLNYLIYLFFSFCLQLLQYYFPTRFGCWIMDSSEQMSISVQIAVFLHAKSLWGWWKFMIFSCLPPKAR